jgi:TatD DNase family protein
MGVNMLIDSHCHLDMISDEIDLVLERAYQKKVGYFLCPGVDLARLPKALELGKKYPNIFIAAGFHPTERKKYHLTLKELEQAASDPLIVAVGETGLDYYYAENESEKDAQQERFLLHLEVAKKLNKPLIIHSREAAEDLISILKKETKISGVMHCFTENWEFAKKFLDLGFYLSFSGIVTFPKANLVHEVAKKAPLDRVLIETDSPYLAPQAVRGKPNQPSYLPYIAEAMAILRNETPAKIAEQTSKNFFDLFSLARVAL